MDKSCGTHKRARTVTWRGPRLRLAVGAMAVAAIAPVAMFAATASTQAVPGTGGMTPAGSTWNSVVQVQPAGSSWNGSIRISPDGSSWN